MSKGLPAYDIKYMLIVLKFKHVEYCSIMSMQDDASK